MSQPESMMTPEEEEYWRSMDKPSQPPKELPTQRTLSPFDDHTITSAPGYEPMHRQASITKDNINPSHYKRGDIECIDALRSCLTPEEFRGYCKGSAMAYLWRMGKKDDVRQEAEKAIWYETWLAGRDPRK